MAYRFANVHVATIFNVDNRTVVLRLQVQFIGSESSSFQSGPFTELVHTMSEKNDR